MKSLPLQSLARGLSVLETVARHEDGMTVQQIAHALGITRPTAHNLAATLLAGRYLIKLAKPTRYRLGPALGELLEVSSRGARRLNAHELLAKLVQDHRGAGFVYAEAGSDEMRLVWRVDFKRPDVIERVDREVSHPYETATALVFHAFAAEHGAVALRRRFTYEEFGQPVWGPRKVFDAFLEKTRELGYCLPPPFASPREMSAMAVPIFRDGKTLAGSLGAFWLQGTSEVDTAKCLKDLQEAAAQLMHKSITCL